MIDFSSLESAVAQLTDALDLADGDLARSDPRLALHMRAASIQAFEFTYELAIKTLRRYLESVDANPASIDQLEFAALVRKAHGMGLLGEEIAAWRDFRRHRGATSHSYDAAKAQEVFVHIPRFLAEAGYLLQALRMRQTAA